MWPWISVILGGGGGEIHKNNIDNQYLDLSIQILVVHVTACKV